MGFHRLSRSRFDPFNSFVRRFHKVIVIVWIVALALSVTLIPSFFSGVSYDITSLGKFGGPSNAESQVAQNILNAQFPSMNTSATNGLILVIQNPSQGAYSDAVKGSLAGLDQTLASQDVVNYTGATSVFTTEGELLNSTVPGLLQGAAAIASNMTAVNQAVFALDQNLTALSSGLFQFEQGINQTAQLIYGIPSSFVTIWGSLNQSNPALADSEANATIFAQTGAFGGNSESVGYYDAFYGYWDASFQSAPSLSVTQRESAAIAGAVGQIVSSPLLDNQTVALISTVSAGLNVTDWYQSDGIGNLTVTAFASNVPASLASSLGVSPQGLVLSLYELGPSPSEAELTSVAVPLIASGFSAYPSPIPGLSVSDLVSAAASLGPSPSPGAVWNLSAGFIASSTAAAFSNSPLFTVNATSLGQLLSSLTPASSSSQVTIAIEGVVSNSSYSDFPLVASRTLTQNFVSSDNQTEIVLFSFSSTPSKSAISTFEADVNSSELSSTSTTYVTGVAVIAQQVEQTFLPILGTTVGPGIVVSIIIVGILFGAPLAAILPLCLGGLSIAIAYAIIYLVIVVAQKGQITFLTPTLTTLLMLGLAVDYSVLQLRRTKEERTNGRSKEESVATSVRWAGQAVLTAGLTVIVAYFVMAVVNVPIFNDVGTSIALGVAVLLLASVTLLPSLELLLGDSLFWPRLKVNHGPSRPGLLAKISDATLKRKLAVALVITLFAAGAVAATASTPTGMDMLKLIPDFQSIHGLTVITSSLGSGSVSPNRVLVTTSTPIVYGDNQFNMTLMGQIDAISSKIAARGDVSSVSGPTRPFGEAFNYSSIETLGEPLSAQYLSQVMSFIGKNNSTALINVGFTSAFESPQSVSSLQGMESDVRSLQLLPGVSVYYGGSVQQTLDNEQFIGGLVPEVTIILSIAVFVILFFQLRSAFTPLRLVFTILCSVAFALSLLSFTFNYALGLPILNFIPLFVIVTMLGVGIDYDIFYVTRIREEILNGKSDDEAIKTATTKVWVTIFSLGLILSSVFGSLLVTGIPIFQEISLAVSAAVLIDVVVVILFFVPSLMALAERFNWWPSKIGKGSQRKA